MTNEQRVEQLEDDQSAETQNSTTTILSFLSRMASSKALDPHSPPPGIHAKPGVEMPENGIFVLKTQSSVPNVSQFGVKEVLGWSKWKTLKCVSSIRNPCTNADCVMSEDKINQILPIGGPKKTFTPLVQGKIGRYYASESQSTNIIVFDSIF
ncbi:hypothetical protein Scep_002024 [Stephania cephalantha]|uniref:Uncharacterized protein n=1 Tax=Stephania cephalantha TaxID=152367 RepID=A0AAP0LAH6_9MAGN